MKDKVFVDTNILIYAHDKDAGAKHRVAATASQAGAVKLLSEDLNHGQIVEGVLIHNPLL